MGREGRRGKEKKKKEKKRKKEIDKARLKKRNEEQDN